MVAAVIMGGLLVPAIFWALRAGGTRASDDLGKLQGMVQIAIPATAIKWEIVKVPDDEGLLAVGPVDYVHLVAEITPGERAWFARQPNNDAKLWIAPDAARPWLTPHFRQLLASGENDWRRKSNCKPHHTTVTASGRQVGGFVCEHQGLLLLHLMLAEP